MNEVVDDLVEDLKFELLNRQLAAAFLTEETRKFIQKVPGLKKPSESVAKAILLRNGWNVSTALNSVSSYNLCDTLKETKAEECDVCGMDDEKFLSPSCGHGFCIQCWKYHASQAWVKSTCSSPA